MKPAIGSCSALTDHMRYLELWEGILFLEFRNGIIIKRTRPPKHTQMYYGLHVVDEDMIANRPRGDEVTT